MFSSFIDRFSRGWLGEPNSGCWLWNGELNRAGYGYMYVSKGEMEGFSKKRILAHRASYIIHYGKIPDGLEVCHRCDTPACVRPDHLFVATHRENMDDRDRKGRCEKGDDRKCSVLSSDVVKVIIPSSESISDLAKKYGVSFQTISDIKRGKLWKHVPGVRVRNASVNIKRGENHPRAKLSMDDVFAIRVLCSSGETQRNIAKKFGVSKSLIGCISRGENWRISL